MLSLRPQWRVSEVHLNQAYKPCSIRVIPSQTYGNVSNGGGLLTPSDDLALMTQNLQPWLR